MKTLGIILVVVGIVMLIWGGFSYTRSEEVVDIGPVEMDVEKTEQVNWPPYAGAVAAGIGALLILADRRK